MLELLINRKPLAYKTHRFSGGEEHVNINKSLFEKMLPPFFGDEEDPVIITIKGNLRSSSAIIQVLLLADAIENLMLNLSYDNYEIELITPYLPYARQDRRCAEGDAFSLRVFSNLLDGAPIRRVICADAHSIVAEQEVAGLITIPQQVCLKETLKRLDIDVDKMSQDMLNGNLVMVAPDAGAVDKTEACRKIFYPPNVTPMNQLNFHKTRDPYTGQITGMVYDGIDLTGKTVMICDDICDGGRTFIEVAKVLSKKYNIPRERMILYVTHGIFSNGFSELSKWYGEIITYNDMSEDELPEGEVLPR